MSRYNEQHATTMLNALIGTDTLAYHDKQIRDEAIIETLESVIKMIANWGYGDLSSVVLRENLKARIKQIKEEQNE